MQRIVRHHAAVALAFTLAFVVNPAYVTGCLSSGEDDVDTRAIEASLLDQLEDVNAETYAFTASGTSYELLVALSQRRAASASAELPRASGLLRAAHACGSHTFYQRASACATRYELALEGTFMLRRLGDQPATVAADVAVEGWLAEGQVWLELADGGAVTIERTEDGYEVGSVELQDLGQDALDLSYDRDAAGEQ